MQGCLQTFQDSTSSRGGRSASFSDTEIAAMEKWTVEERKNVCLTIFVGSRVMQIALCPVTSAKKAIYTAPIQICKSRDVIDYFESLRGHFARYRSTVVFSTMSFAGPVSQDHVVVTNWKCEARERVIYYTQLPFDIFPLDRRKFMNDLEAASYGIIAKNLNGSLPQIFVNVWTPHGGQKPISLDGSSLVLSIGTGFGVSFICRTESSDYNCVVSSEAGHAQAYTCQESDPKYYEELDFIRFFSKKLHGGSHEPEWEDICAIRGLELAYQYFKQNHQATDVEKWPNYDQIRDLALNGDQDAMKAFKIHYRFIIRAAQAISLGIKSQRVFLISDRQVKNAVVIKTFCDELQEEFENHPRSSWLKETVVYAQNSISRFALSGGLLLSRVFAVSHQKQSHVQTS